jgi:transcriptional regulator of met regulon
MGFTYRKQMTPGMKACKDYFESGKKMERPKKITKDIPPQIYKLKK